MSRDGVARTAAICIVVTLAIGFAVLTGPPVWHAVFGDPAASPSSAPATAGPSATPIQTIVPTTAPPVLDSLSGAGAVDTEIDGPTSAAGIRAALAPYVAEPTLGPGPGVAVAAEQGELLVDVDAATPRTPASTAKILTATAALASLGPDTRFTTSVELSRPGQIVLVGGGDPALSRRSATDDAFPYPFTSIEDLARRTASALQASGTTSVTLGYRADLFSGPDVSPDWAGAYVSAGQVGPLSALAVDGGREQPGLALRTLDPAAYTAQAFAELLGSYGVTVRGEPAIVTTAAGVQIAATQSPTVTDLVTQLLVRSDNDIAEVLAHHVARAEGAEATFAGASRAVPEVLTRLGVPIDGLVLQDGSGLSRGNLVAPATLVAALQLALADDHPELRPVLAGLPIAGFNGTLTDRFADAQSASQVGDVRAKTGYLSGVVSLAGYVVDEQGQPLVFAVMADQVSADPGAAQQSADRLAAALAGCGCP